MEYNNFGINCHYPLMKVAELSTEIKWNKWVSNGIFQWTLLPIYIKYNSYWYTPHTRKCTKDTWQDKMTDRTNPRCVILNRSEMKDIITLHSHLMCFMSPLLHSDNHNTFCFRYTVNHIDQSVRMKIQCLLGLQVLENVSLAQKCKQC